MELWQTILVPWAAPGPRTALAHTHRRQPRPPAHARASIPRARPTRPAPPSLSPQHFHRRCCCRRRRPRPAAAPPTAGPVRAGSVGPAGPARVLPSPRHAGAARLLACRPPPWFRNAAGMCRVEGEERELGGGGRGGAGRERRGTMERAARRPRSSRRRPPTTILRASPCHSPCPTPSLSLPTITPSLFPPCRCGGMAGDGPPAVGRGTGWRGLTDGVWMSAAPPHR
jgi:hypothetical protein